MTYKQLIQKLIEHYQFGVDNLPMEDWDDESFLSDMTYCIDKLYNGIELARMYYKNKK